MNPRIVIADSQRVLLEGVAALLGNRGIDVVGTADTGEKAIHLIRQLMPDLVLMDIETLWIDGVMAMQAIKQELPSVKVLVFSLCGDPDRISQVMKARASGYVLKRVGLDELGEIIRAYHAGRTFVSPFLANLAFADDSDMGVPGRAAMHSSLELLSPQEQRVLELIVKGLNNQEIANAICVSRDTVKAHLKQIFRTLRVKNRIQAAVIAVKQRFGNR